jgi:membrane associated rhomboid family serine protease
MPLPAIDFRRAPVTISLAMVIAALEIVCTLDPDRRFYYYNDLKLGIAPRIWLGELWRPFTTTLLHGTLLHAALNLAGLWVFGHVLEERLGSLRFLVVCVLLAYVSMLPEFLVTCYYSNVQIVGFSGVIYGLFGMLWIGRRWNPAFHAVCTDDIVRLLLGWLVLCIGLTVTRIMPVANFAHGFGLLFGVLYGLAAFSPQRRRWWLAAGLATLAVLSALLGFPGHRGYEATRQWRQLQHELRMLRLHPQPPASRESDR